MPSGNHVRQSRITQIPRGKHDRDRADRITVYDGLTYVTHPWADVAWSISLLQY